MKIHVTITHYERPRMLKNLVNQVHQQIQGATVRVYDDGSKTPISASTKAEIIRCVHGGRRSYYALWNRIFAELPPADLYLFFPDDVKLAPTFWKDVSANILPHRPDVVNLLNDKGRTGRSNWGSGFATVENTDLLNTNWWDMCGIMTPRAAEVMRKNPIVVRPSRWANNLALGSGVGQAITKVLRRRKIAMHQTRRALVDHLGHKSKMNPIARKSDPLDTWDMPQVIAGMATVPGREKQAQRTIKSVLPYVDFLAITYNDPNGQGVPQWLETLANASNKIHARHADNRKGDAEKFWAITPHNSNYYYLSIDDDIIYPPGYTWHLIHKIEQYNRSAAVGVHAKTLPERVDSFYGHSAQHHTKSALKRDQVVNCLGTGTLAFHSSTIDFGMKDCETANMADIWFAIACQRQNVPQIAVARPRDWLKVQNLPKGTTIYEQHHQVGTVQTEIWNNCGVLYGWELKTKYLKR